MEVIFKHDIVDWATGDHPDLIVARKGQKGVLTDQTGDSDWEAYVRIQDGTIIGCNFEEFKCLPLKT